MHFSYTETPVPLSLPCLGLHPMEKGQKQRWEVGNLPGFLLLSGPFLAQRTEYISIRER